MSTGPSPLPALARAHSGGGGGASTPRANFDEFAIDFGAKVLVTSQRSYLSEGMRNAGVVGGETGVTT